MRKNRGRDKRKKMKEENDITPLNSLFWGGWKYQKFQQYKFSGKLFHNTHARSGNMGLNRPQNEKKKT